MRSLCRFCLRGSRLTKTYFDIHRSETCGRVFAGFTLAVEKFAFDFRYWDTNIDLGVYDERFVFAATVTLP